MGRWRRQWLTDRRALIVVIVACAVVAGVAFATGLVGGESKAFDTGRDVGIALFKSGTPIEKCADVRSGAGLEGLDSEDEQRDFYEGCLDGYESAAEDR